MQLKLIDFGMTVVDQHRLAAWPHGAFELRRSSGPTFQRPVARKPICSQPTAQSYGTLAVNFQQVASNGERFASALVECGLSRTCNPKLHATVASGRCSRQAILPGTRDARHAILRASAWGPCKATASCLNQRSVLYLPPPVCTCLATGVIGRNGQELPPDGLTMLRTGFQDPLIADTFSVGVVLFGCLGSPTPGAQDVDKVAVICFVVRRARSIQLWISS